MRHAGITPNAEPFSITAGPDGDLWYTELGANQVARITPAGVVSEFSSGHHAQRRSRRHYRWTRSSPRPMESQLDWFHIGMRLELLRKAVVMPVTYQEYLATPQAFDPVQRRVSRLRDALWRGRSWQALLQFAWLSGDINRWAAEHPGRCAQSVRRAKQVIKEFRYYVCGNRRSLPDFAKQRAAGHRISTAHVESVMNHLVNHRLSKKAADAPEPGGGPLSDTDSHIGSTPVIKSQNDRIT